MHAMTQRILIIEDDMALQQMLALHFEDQGCQVATAGTCRDGLAASEDRFDIVLLDQQLPDGEGIDLLPELVAAPTVNSVVMMTGQHDLELAISAIKAGAALPAFSLTNARGNTVKSADLLAQGAVVLTVFRGSW